MGILENMRATIVVGICIFALQEPLTSAAEQLPDLSQDREFQKMIHSLSLGELEGSWAEYKPTSAGCVNIVEIPHGEPYIELGTKRRTSTGAYSYSGKRVYDFAWANPDQLRLTTNFFGSDCDKSSEKKYDDKVRVTITVERQRTAKYARAKRLVVRTSELRVKRGNGSITHPAETHIYVRSR